MARFRYTMGFNGEDHGFTESWYTERTSEDMEPVLADFGKVRVARQKLLGKGWAIVKEVMALVLDNAGAKITRVAIENEIFLKGATANLSAEPGISLLCLATTSDRRNKKLSYLGGPWESIFPGEGTYDPGPADGPWLTNLNSYQSALVAAQAGWLHQVPGDPKGVITGYTLNAVTGQTTYTLAAGTPWTGELNVPVRVSVDFPTTRSPLDGVQLVIFQDATHATTAKPRPAAAFDKNGTMTFYSFELKTLSTLNAQQRPGTFVGERPVERKRGRPLFTSPGRLPARIRW